MLRKIIVEGLDRLGKNLLIDGIQDVRGYHQVLHFTKPIPLKCYDGSLEEYQRQSFTNMFKQFKSEACLIANRAHLGEYVYAPMYRKYSAEYIFELEKLHLSGVNDLRLILLTENFALSNHFVDDGLSLGAPNKREAEQALFIEAFNRSIIPDKRMICVTAFDGQFKPPAEILRVALAS